MKFQLFKFYKNSGENHIISKKFAAPSAPLTFHKMSAQITISKDFAAPSATLILKKSCCKRIFLKFPGGPTVSQDPDI